LRRHYDAFQAAGAEVVVVGMGTPAQTAAFIDAQSLPFPVLADPTRQAYRAYGVIRGNMRQVMLDPRVWVRGAQAAATGHRQGRTVGNPLQLSATFIVDPQGRIHFARRAELSSDFAGPDELLAALTSPAVNPVPLA
jgi:alkyl hydroperoxide reductase subunit AhpC